MQVIKFICETKKNADELMREQADAGGRISAEAASGDPMPRASRSSGRETEKEGS